MAKAKKQYECVLQRGSEKKANKVANQYRGRGYIVDIVPRINSYLDAFSGEYSVFVRKVIVDDVRKKSAQ